MEMGLALVEACRLLDTDALALLDRRPGIGTSLLEALDTSFKNAVGAGVRQDMRAFGRQLLL